MCQLIIARRDDRAKGDPKGGCTQRLCRRMFHEEKKKKMTSEGTSMYSMYSTVTLTLVMAGVPEDDG